MRRYARQNDEEQDDAEPQIVVVQVKDAFGLGFALAAGMFVFNLLIASFVLATYLLLR